MRQGQAFVLSALFLLCVGAAAAARQGNPPDTGGTAISREGGGHGLERAGQGGVAHERASGREPAEQGNPSNVGGTAAAAPAPASTSASSTSSSASTAATTDAGTAGAPAKHKSHAAKCTYKGTVAAVDATAKSFVVHPAKGDDVTLKVNDKTKYGPKGRGWDDVKADARVSGTCKKDGTDTWAVSVKFWPAPKAKAEPAPKSGNPGDIGGPPTKTGAR